MDSSGTDDDCILDKAVQRFYVYVTTWELGLMVGYIHPLFSIKVFALMHIVLRFIRRNLLLHVKSVVVIK